MKNPLAIFKLKPEERWLAAACLLVFTGLNALLIGSEWDLYVRPLLHGGSWGVFKNHFEMSGYDCWSWIMLSEGKVFFDTLRHPLFFSVLYPLWHLNRWLMEATGINWAVFIMAAILVFCATYAAIFTYRILRGLMGVGRADATLLVALLFSFGHVMVPVMVPDHFIVSMMLLTMTAWVCGRKMQQHRPLPTGQAAALLFLTSGIAASNGVKVILGDFLTRGRRFFRPRHLLLGVVVPLAALLAIQRCQYQAFEVPQAEKIHRMERQNEAKMTAAQKAARDRHDRWVDAHDMKPAAENGLLRLMDFETPRLPAFVENVCGESLLLHRSHALEDELRSRPMVVGYQSWWCYAVTSLVMLLFAVGLWKGRRERVVQMLACWLAFDFLLNMVLGFAINEVYIMTSGWAFAVPVAIAALLSDAPRWRRRALRGVVAVLTVVLLANNLSLVVGHLY